MTTPVLHKWMRSGDPSQSDAGVEGQTAPFQDQLAQRIVPRTMRNFAFEISQLLTAKFAPYALIPYGHYNDTASLPASAPQGAVATVALPAYRYWGFDGAGWVDMGPVPGVQIDWSIDGVVDDVPSLPSPPVNGEGSGYVTADT